MGRNEGRTSTQAERSRTRRERILDAAFHTFSRRGYRDTAMDEIAAAAPTAAIMYLPLASVATAYIVKPLVDIPCLQVTP